MNKKVKQSAKKIWLIWYLFMGLIIGYIIISMNVYGSIIIPINPINNETIEKTALKEDSLAGNKYIICKLRSGFYYYLVSDENGTKTSQQCKITGVDLQNELSNSLLSSNNSFIFYIIDTEQYYDEEIAQYVTEYKVNGWDILYPVKRGSFFDLTPNYILVSDLASGSSSQL